MAADEDELPDDGVRDVDESDPESGKRMRRKPAETVELLLAEFRRRAKGLTGDELQGEVDLLVDRVVDLHAAAVPRALRDEYREMMRGMVEEDPIFREVVDQMRAAAARDPI